MNIRDQAWAMILNAERFSHTGISKTIRMQYRSYMAARVNGERLALALEPGEKAIEPFIFLSGGEMLERAVGNLLSMRA